MFIICSCNFNTVYKDEQSEKEKAEKVLAQFYQSIQSSEYDKTTNFLSNEFYKYTTREEYLSFLEKINKDYGNYLSRDLIDWRTIRVEGANPKSEYYLSYIVKYEKGITKESFKLEKESDTIYIFRYDLKRK